MSDALAPIIFGVGLPAIVGVLLILVLLAAEISQHVSQHHRHQADKHYSAAPSPKSAASDSSPTSNA